MSSGGLYGAEHMFLSLAGGLRGLNCRVVLGIFHNSQAGRPELEQAARELGIETEVIPCEGRWDWSCLRRIRQWLRSLAPEIVHCHGYKADLYGFGATRGLGAPLVATCHNWTNENRQLTLYAKADRLVLRHFHHVAAVSESVRSKLFAAGVASRKMSVVGNGVPVEAISSAAPTLGGLSEGKYNLVGAVGRLVPTKGFDVLLEAAPRVLAEAPSTRFVIVGEGPDRARLEEIVRRNSLEGRVILTGSRSDMPGVYRSLSQFVLPSLNEGMPMSVLEAMAAGLPVVSTRVGAVPKLLEDSRAGVVVKPGDAAQLATAILRLLGQPAEARAMGLNGFGWVKDRFSSRHMAQTYLSLYESLLGRGSGGSHSLQGSGAAA